MRDVRIRHRELEIEIPAALVAALAVAVVAVAAAVGLVALRGSGAIAAEADRAAQLARQYRDVAVRCLDATERLEGHVFDAWLLDPLGRHAGGPPTPPQEVDDDG